MGHVLIPLKIVILRQLFCFLLLFGLTVPCFAQKADPETDKMFTADVLKATLFARTADEKKFCDNVIRKRDDGTIPARLIYGVHRKAVTQDKGRRFTYFKTGLEIACKREGIILNPTPTRVSPTTPSLIRPSFKNPWT